MDNQEFAGVTERAFRETLGLFPTGVAVVTAVTSLGTRLGLTVSSFNSVSLSPPLVLFSIAKRALHFALWQTVDRYAINFLTEDQDMVSNRFASAGRDKWEGVSVLSGATKVPILPNVLAALECTAHARYEGGDHEIHIGRVVAISSRQPTNPHPLIFYRGRYTKLGAEMGTADPLSDAMFPHGW
jgi:flavin reductase (DIM6/NTAB) family NADH-FMN oxidoreductase RutF